MWLHMGGGGGELAHHMPLKYFKNKGPLRKQTGVVAILRQLNKGK
jgi:hypothetical protein